MFAITPHYITNQQQKRAKRLADLDDSFSPKLSFCGAKEIFASCLFFCIFSLIIYIPIYSAAVARRENEAIIRRFPWKVNSTRDLAIYVHPDNVTAIIANESLCNENPFLLIVVCSAVGNYKARQAVRQTWMSRQALDAVSSDRPNGSNRTDNVGVRIVFLLGINETAADDKLQIDVIDESSRYGDIIQEGFHDSYLNLTLKTVMMLKWVKNYCPNVTFVMKTDDDMFVNVGALSNYLTCPEVKNRKDLIVGSLLCKNPIDKNLRSKWYSPPHMFEGKLFPDFVSGTGYVMSAALVPAMFEMSLQVPLFHLEDVFLTGIVAQKLNLTPENYHLFSAEKQPLHPLLRVCRYRQLISSHGFNSGSLKLVWHKVTSKELDCTNSSAIPKMRDPDFKFCNQTLILKNKPRP